MKKILFIHHAEGWGGAPNCMINLIKGLDQAKFSGEVLLLKDSVVAEKLAENGINFRIADSHFYKRFYKFFPHSEAGYVKWYELYKFFILGISWMLSRYIFAKRELLKHKYDIVHLNSSVLTDWLSPAKKNGSVIIHVREPFRKGTFDFLHNFFRSQIIKYADAIIAISQDNARRINIPLKTTIIYDYCNIPAKNSPEGSYTSKKVLYLGGSSISKGFYTLVDALEYLHKDVKVFFAGHYVVSHMPRKILPWIKYQLSNARKRNAAIQKMNNSPNSKIIGLIHNVGDYLDEVCCLVSPFSVPHFSCPVIEAHMYKKPAIGTDVEGMDEIIFHEKNGIIVPNNDPKALASAINNLTNDSKKAKQLGVEGFKTAIIKFTSSNITQFEKLYFQLLEKRHDHY